MDTEALRLFVLAADKLNISAAGNQLGMAPSVASSKLAKLEKQMGAELLHRSTRQVSLSLEGSDFLPYAREMLAQEDAAYAALGRGSKYARGTLRFTAPSTFAQMYIAPLLPRFLEQQPEISLDLRFTDLQMSLIEGSFDLALRNSASEDSNLKGRKLASDTRILCAAPGYLKRFGTPKDPRELNEHQLIAFKDTSAKKLIANGTDEGVFNPGASLGRVTIDDGLSQKLATIAGVGISVNSIWSVHQELKDKTLVRVLPDYIADDQSALWLLYPKTNVLTPKVRIFIDFLLEHLSDLPEDV